jgi:hypothetical protein
MAERIILGRDNEMPKLGDGDPHHAWGNKKSHMSAM